MPLTQAEIDALPDELVIQLRKPLEFAGQSYSNFTVREPNGGQLDLIAGAPNAESLSIQLCTGLPAQVVAMMPAREFKKASRFILGFISDVQETGS